MCVVCRMDGDKKEKRMNYLNSIYMLTTQHTLNDMCTLLHKKENMYQRNVTTPTMLVMMMIIIRP